MELERRFRAYNLFLHALDIHSYIDINNVINISSIS